MNIELLEEVKDLQEHGKSLQQIADIVSIPKSNISLMLRMEDILKQKYLLDLQKINDDLEILKSENITLFDEKEELYREINLLKFKIQELKNPFLVTPLKILDFSFYKERNITLENENYLLLEENRIFQTSLNKIPMFIRKIFN